MVRRLIWLYFWLLIIEGALRKWIMPGWSNPLLLVRDPVLIAIYLFAIPAKVFPRNGWTWILLVIGFLSLLISFVQLWLYLPPTTIALVTGYGFRSNYLHLPLIFVMAKVLRPEDVKRFGWWTLVVLVPMAILMVLQFRAAPDAFVNRTAGGEGEMMMSAMGKVRTAATFSFVTGVVAYFALATGFLVWALLRRTVYNNWLLAAAGTALGDQLDVRCFRMGGRRLAKAIPRWRDATDSQRRYGCLHHRLGGQRLSLRPVAERRAFFSRLLHEVQRVLVGRVRGVAELEIDAPVAAVGAGLAIVAQAQIMAGLNVQRLEVHLVAEFLGPAVQMGQIVGQGNVAATG